MCIFTTVTFVFNTKIISDGSEFVANVLIWKWEFGEFSKSKNMNLPDFDVESKPGHQCFEYHSRLTWGTKNFISIFSLVRPSPSRRLSLIFQFSSLVKNTAKNEMFYLISSQDFSFQFHNDSICFDFSVVELSTVQTWLWLFTLVSISFLVSCCFHHV